jgi:hypothetical protein
VSARDSVSGEPYLNINPSEAISPQGDLLCIGAPSSLKPHRLPNAGGRRERDPVVVIARNRTLLSMRDRTLVGWSSDLDGDHHGGTGGQVLSDVELE